MTTKVYITTELESICQGADCQGCDGCPDVPNGTPIVDLLAEREEWTYRKIIAAMEPEQIEAYHEIIAARGPQRTIDYLDLGLFPPQHPVEAAALAVKVAAHEAQRQSSPSDATSSMYSQKDIDSVAPRRIDYQESKLPSELRCPFFGFAFGTMVCAAGDAYKVPRPCGKCEQCKAAVRYRKLEQYTKGIYRRSVQTMVKVEGLADDSAASDARSYIGKRLPALRFAAISRDPDTYLWRAVVVFVDPIDDVRLALNLRQRYPDATIGVDSRSIPAIQLEAYLPTDKKSASGHISSVFSQGWIKPRRATETYQFGEATIDEVPTGDKAVPYVQHHCEHCDKVARRSDNPEWQAAANSKAVIQDMPVDREALADLGEALAIDDTDAAKEAYDRAVPAEFPYDFRRLIFDTAGHVERTADGVSLMPTARLAHLVVWLNTMEEA